MQQREYTTFDKSTWGEGPWQNEPDKVQFVDRATGYPCLVVRSGGSGALCGYVGVPEGHKFHGKHYDTEDLRDVNVHGGLTFSDKCSPNGTEERSICHVPEPGESDNVWWFGFDTAHCWDISPAMDATLRSIGHKPMRVIDDRMKYRRIGYVKRNIAKLALQLKDLE